MIRYSSFNYVALLHSLLANVSAHRSREWGTIAAVVRRRPPWFIVFYRSMHVCCRVFFVICTTNTSMWQIGKIIAKFAILVAGSTVCTHETHFRAAFPFLLLQFPNRLISSFFILRLWLLSTNHRQMEKLKTVTVFFSFAHRLKCICGKKVISFDRWTNEH